MKNTDVIKIAIYNEIAEMFEGDGLVSEMVGEIYGLIKMSQRIIHQIDALECEDRNGR